MTLTHANVLATLY